MEDLLNQKQKLLEVQIQFDLWNLEPSTRYDWQSLKTDIQAHGIRNSLLLAPMPTASTSQILGNNECFEPFTSNIYVRRTIAGEFIMVNKYLMEEMFLCFLLFQQPYGAWLQQVE